MEDCKICGGSGIERIAVEGFEDGVGTIINGWDEVECSACEGSGAVEVVGVWQALIDMQDSFDLADAKARASAGKAWW